MKTIYTLMGYNDFTSGEVLISFHEKEKANEILQILNDYLNKKPIYNSSHTFNSEDYRYEVMKWRYEHLFIDWSGYNSFKVYENIIY